MGEKIIDKRFDLLSEIILNYSLKLNSSDTVLLRGDEEFFDFLETFRLKAHIKGAKAEIECIDNYKLRNIIIRADVIEMADYLESMLEKADKSTAIVDIPISSSESFLNDVSPDKIINYIRKIKNPYIKSLSKPEGIFSRKWVSVGYPLDYHARQAGLSFDRYKDMFFSSTIMDWSRIRDELNEIEAIFSNAKEIVISAPQTLLSFSLEGIKGELGCGIHNIPDGEVYFNPVNESINGKIFFPYSYYFEGVHISEILLTFKEGKIVDYESKSNQKMLDAIFKMEGVTTAREVGFGCNRHINSYVSHPLFYEKIAGTVHLGLGSSSNMPFSKSNKDFSEIHWDIMCDLRKTDFSEGGSIYVDGSIVQNCGKWFF